MHKEYQFFNREEEKELWQRWKKEGCLDSRNMLVESVIPLVMKIVARKSVEQNHDDMLSEACYAVIQLLNDDKFDPDKGRLTTYTIRKVLSKLNNYLWYDQLIKVPKRAKHCEPLEDYSFISHDEMPDFLELELLRKCLNKLPRKWRSVVRRRMRGETLISIASHLGISKERVRQLYTKALERLRRDYKSRTMPSNRKQLRQTRRT